MVASRGRKAFLIASGVAQLSAFVRYVALSRILGPEQLGLAAILIITVQFFELVSEGGAASFVLQDPKGDEVEVQRLVQSVMLGRGVLTLIGLALVASPIAAFYAEAALAPALAAIGLAPLIASLACVDMRRMQRRGDFRIEARALAAAEIGSLVATVVAALATRDFSAVIYGALARAAIFAAVSYLGAERGFLIGWSRAHAGRFFAYSWPLVLNGVLLFVCAQGDRIIVSKEAGTAALGVYSAAILLVMAPVALVRRYMEAVHLPLIAGARATGTENAVAGRYGGRIALLAAAVSLGFAVLAPIAVPVIYGPEFGQPAAVLGLVGVLVCARLLQSWPQVTSLANGFSGVAFAGNLVRLVSLPAVWASVAITGGGLYAVVLGFVIGETFAAAAGAVFNNRRLGLPMFTGFERMACFIAAAALVGFVGLMLDADATPLSAAGAALSAAALLWTLYRQRDDLRGDWRLAAQAVRRGRPS